MCKYFLLTHLDYWVCGGIISWHIVHFLNSFVSCEHKNTKCGIRVCMATNKMHWHCKGNFCLPMCLCQLSERTKVKLTTSSTFSIHLKITVLFKLKLETGALYAIQGGPNQQEEVHWSPRDQRPLHMFLCN